VPALSCHPPTARARYTSGVPRSFLVAVVLIAGCKSKAGTPAPPTPPVEQATPAVVEGPLARLAAISGPHATFEAACPEAACRAVDVQPAASAGGPVREIRILAVTGNNEGECGIALHTDAGWFLATQKEDAASCEEPSYVLVEAATLERTDAVAVVEVTVAHHTKDHDDEGEHVWSSVCGVAAKGPWCTHQITTACDPYVCVSDQVRWERTIEVGDDGTMVVTTASTSEAARRDAGTFKLPR